VIAAFVLAASACSGGSESGAADLVTAEEPSAVPTTPPVRAGSGDMGDGAATAEDATTAEDTATDAEAATETDAEDAATATDAADAVTDPDTDAEAAPALSDPTAVPPTAVPPTVVAPTAIPPTSEPAPNEPPAAATVALPSVDVVDLGSGQTTNLSGLSRPGATLVWFWAPH
jgi:hypothetical protein